MNTPAPSSICSIHTSNELQVFPARGSSRAHTNPTAFETAVVDTLRDETVLSPARVQEWISTFM